MKSKHYGVGRGVMVLAFGVTLSGCANTSRIDVPPPPSDHTLMKGMSPEDMGALGRDPDMPHGSQVQGGKNSEHAVTEDKEQ